MDQTAGRALLDDTYSVDLHAHPGLIPALASTTTAGHRRAIEIGNIRAICLAAVGDLSVLGWRPRRGIRATRTPRPGELFDSTWRQLDALDSQAQQMALGRVRGGRDLAAAAATGARSFLLAIEGGDFLEGRLDRLQVAYDRGVRSLQLVHYRVNELGDIQTEAPVHGGLSAFGREVVAEMNRLGMVIDLAHATFEVVQAAIDTSTRPVMISHTNIRDATGFPRFITADHARLVARHGGVIGAWPVSVRAAGFSAFIDHIARLVEVVGIDHVGIGTDMDGTGPSGLFTDYAQWPSIPAALLASGFARRDVANVMGDNFRRLVTAVTT